MKITTIYLFILLLSIKAFPQKDIRLNSPDESLQVGVKTSEQITYSIKKNGETIIFPSSISMKLSNGKSFGTNSKLEKAKCRLVKQIINSPYYKQKEITDNYNEVVLIFKEFNLIFRAYNEGIAYRFESTGKQDFIVEDEEVNFELGSDSKAYIPYVRGDWTSMTTQFANSFENVYAYNPVSQWEDNRIAFLPLVVERPNGLKICITEADLENYPGMYLYNPSKKTNLKACFAPYPKVADRGGYNELQLLVTEYEKYIAKCKAKTKFPWRVIIISSQDKELANMDMVYKLASPARIDGSSWIKPGKAAWDWWNNWKLSGVDFKSGINTMTYKYYIDFASKYGIEYIVMDEGWSVKGSDLFQVVPEIDLEELVDYAADNNVGIILWAGFYPFSKDMEKVCEHYSAMGIKGFKVDFINRDDQLAVKFHYKCAETAARYHLLIDFHGTYKPTGLNRTYPNVLNFEGVYGLEQLKFSGRSNDQVVYDVTIPFIRQVAGPMDYTPGAMRNAIRENFRSINAEPMSQGTRCRQLAQYIIFDAPLAMLCDSPVNYETEKDCTEFITSIPTVWDSTIVLDGKISSYIIIARKKDNVWYVGAMTDWTERTLELDLSFLGEGNFQAEIFKDGINADKIASDYNTGIIDVPSSKRMFISLSPGGGCAMRIAKK